MGKHVSGPSMYIDWIDNSGTIQWQADYQKFNFPRKVDKVDVTAGADSSKDYLPTLKDYTFTWEGFFDDSGASGSMGTAMLNRLAEGNFGTVRWGHSGTASGKPKGAAYVFVESQEIDYPYDNAMTVKLTLQVTGGAGLLSDPNVATW